METIFSHSENVNTSLIMGAAKLSVVCTTKPKKMKNQSSCKNLFSIGIYLLSPFRGYHLQVPKAILPNYTTG